MKTESRNLSSIKRRRGAVVLRSDFANLGGASQVTEALNSLQSAGVIARVSSGVYVKTTKDRATGEVKLVARPEDVAKEAFSKLGYTVKVVKAASSGDDHSLVVDVGDHRVRRRLTIGGKQVAYAKRLPKKRRFSLTSPLQVPKEGVGEYVQFLARKFEVAYKRLTGGAWAEAVTKLAGDEVRSDAINDLLVALNRAHKITDREAVALLVNHRR